MSDALLSAILAELRLELGQARRELAQMSGLLREGLGEHVRLHVHPHFPAWEKRVREALGD